ncbi:EAL domain-containing protein (plasmid) [Komagataeibacter sucrofermentans]|uniref:Bifunctional diguanylate cyclase/phosphodiesterase n=1 Tax=Komagataeibacter sucrofermentans TaxID=1053551 RepID=A0A318QLU7_9PROT|nr:EAL domain-containing protein [Komagataeibacter sucrofermentans]PYD78252.1 bifunctional diguanylate cyclase/phosphodiesterase [Komagataeibacter sucrofermentans]GBQ51489.1 diguanylate cyclase/phosphodiesterase [Komagataeibacter sucrofermentans DSM 15973]
MGERQTYPIPDKLLESIDTGILLVSNDNTIIFANDNAARIWGGPTPGLVGRKLDILFPAGTDILPCIFGENLTNVALCPSGVSGGKVCRSITENHHYLTLLRHDGMAFSAEMSVARTEGAGQQVFVISLRDVTRDLSRREQDLQYATIVQRNACGILILDSQCRIIYANAAAARFSGIGAEGMEGADFSAFLSGQQGDIATLQAFRRRLQRCRPFELEIHSRTDTGQDIWLLATVTPLCSPYEELHEVIVVLNDITGSEQIKALQKDMMGALTSNLSFNEILGLMCRQIERIAPDVVTQIVAVDDEQRMHPVARARLPAQIAEVCADLQIGPEVGSCGTALFTGMEVVTPDIEADPKWKGFWQFVVPHGLMACWSVPILLRDGRVGGSLAFYFRAKRAPGRWHRRIADACLHLCALAIEQQRSREDIARLTQYDTLTGLPNRTGLRHGIRRRAARARHENLLALIINLDRFRAINNGLGRPAGNMLLAALARRLSGLISSDDLLARSGGDEFTLITTGGVERATALADAIMKAVAEPVVIDEVPVTITASIGIADNDGGRRETEILMQQAETALSQAKNADCNCYRFFSEEMNRQAADQILLGNALKEAIRTDQLYLVYQPQVHAATGRLEGVEALARWTDPALGMISPGRFIPLAEETGQIEAIGLWSLQTACRQMALWMQAGVDVPVVSVNISALHFRNPDLPRLIGEILHESGIPPYRLTIELTESAMIENYDQTLIAAQAIRAMGIGLSMDDFGTGFSSLSNLANLPLNELKIDRSFMDGFEPTGKVHSVVTAIIRIGRSLGMTVVAEGVETQAQLDLLRQINCDVIQGYFFSRPLDARDLEAWLQAPPDTGCSQPGSQHDAA